LSLRSLETAATTTTGRVKMSTTTKEWRIPIITLPYPVVEGISRRA